MTTTQNSEKSPKISGVPYKFVQLCLVHCMPTPIRVLELMFKFELIPNNGLLPPCPPPTPRQIFHFSRSAIIFLRFSRNFAQKSCPPPHHESCPPSMGGGHRPTHEKLPKGKPCKQYTSAYILARSTPGVE